MAKQRKDDRRRTTDDGVPEADSVDAATPDDTVGPFWADDLPDDALELDVTADAETPGEPEGTRPDADAPTPNVIAVLPDDADDASAKPEPAALVRLDGRASLNVDGLRMDRGAVLPRAVVDGFPERVRAYFAAVETEG